MFIIFPRNDRPQDVDIYIDELDFYIYQIAYFRPKRCHRVLQLDLLMKNLFIIFPRNDRSQDVDIDIDEIDFYIYQNSSFSAKTLS